jgi:tape measure domain-containing protein
MEIIIAAKDAFSRTFEKFDQDLKELARTGNTASGILDKSFKTLNLRSAFDIEKEKAQMILAFERIKTSGVASATEIKRAQQGLKEQLAELDNKLKGNAGGFMSMKGAAGALSGVLAGVGIGALAKDAIDAALKMQKLETAFRSVSGKDAGREMAFVREEANRLGLDIGTAAGEYGKLAAASKGTALEGEQTRKIFTALSEASAALGMSADEAGGALNAIQQMISKGKVSTEELRQQLGERLPGAFQIAARAMGVTTAELDKMLEQGQVTAEEFLPKLATSLHDTYGTAAVEAATKGQAAINRFNNEMLASKAAVGESLMPAFTDLLKGMKPISEGLMWLLAGFVKIGPLIGGAIDSMIALARAPVDGLEATRKKLAQIETNLLETVDAIDKQYGKQAENSKKTDKELADEKERNDKRRADSAKKTDLDMAKSAEGYAKAVGDTDRLLTEKYEKAYQERKKTVQQYYDEQLKTVQKGTAAYTLLEKTKNEALLKLGEQHKGDAKQIELDKLDSALAVARDGNEERKALIQEQLNQQVITEQQGQKQILDMETEAAGKLYDAKKKRFELIAGLYGQDSEEYKKAMAEMAQAHSAFVDKESAQVQAAAQVRRDELDKSSLDYELELAKRLNWLKDSERDGLITAQQAARDKLEAEKNYLAQVAELRRRELAEAVPDTVEYKQALAAKYQADREYAEAKRALDDQINAENIANQKRGEEEIRKDSEKSLADFRALAQGFYAQWDAITNRVIALGPKVAAAFGVPLKDTVFDTVDKLKTKLDEVAKAVRQAAEASRDMGLFSHLLGEHAERAEQLTYRYYSQRLEVTELTEQLKKMGLATEWQLQYANNLVKKMDLLNDSDLQGVRGEVDRLTQSLKEAQEQADDTVNSLRDELDEMLGNKTAIENRDYEAKKDELLSKLADAQQAGNTAITQEYQEALKLLEEIHKKKMANIKEEAEAAKKAALESSTSSPTAIPGFAGGGRFPGPDSPVDNLIVKVRSGEWGIRNEAVRFWEGNIGRGFMAGINDPLSAAGRQIWERLRAKATAWKDYLYIPTPRVNFATGGAFSDAAEFQGQATDGRVTQIINIYPQRLDEATFRREVLPHMEKVTRLKK